MEESVPRAYTLDAATLKELVRARRCSWKAVAKACGVHPGTVKKWVAGKQAIFADNLAKLASFLGCTIEQLIGKEPYCPQPRSAKQQQPECHGHTGGNTPLATNKGAVAAEIRETKTTIEIIVVGDKESWSEEKLADIYEFILQHLQSKGFAAEKERIVYKRAHFGSVVVTFEMPNEWARELVRAAKNKELLAAGIVDAEITEQVIAGFAVVRLKPSEDAPGLWAAKIPIRKASESQLEGTNDVSPAESSHTTLLQRLDPDTGEESRQLLQELYRPLLLKWLTSDSALAGDAESLAEEILTIVHQQLPDFDATKERAFLAWLRRITATCIQQRCRAKRKEGAKGQGRATDSWPLAELADDTSELSHRWEQDHNEHVARYLLNRIADEF